MKLVALSPESDEFLSAIRLAWKWTQERKRFYCETGGNQTFDEYMADAKAPNRKQIAVVHDARIVSVITVRLPVEYCYEIHVTSQRRAPVKIIRDALLCVRDSLFRELGAHAITTSCPTYDDRHEHKGSRRLAETCGMKPNGMGWVRNGATWREYEITKDQFYGQS